MTESEWLTCTDPSPMIDFLSREGNDRPLLLAESAFCSRIAHHLTDPRSRDAVAALQRLAERGRDSDPFPELMPAVYAAQDASNAFDALGEAATIEDAARVSAATAAGYVGVGGTVSVAVSCQAAADPTGDGSRERAAQADLLREFAHPFRTSPDAAWMTPTVVALVRGIIADAAFDRLPILADALEDAGCADSVLLAHCRGDCPHLPGCWAVELLNHSPATGR
ncbi:hypothetical protein R5W23_000148 [Gemmata sp. JC673]|uniref:Uncharacterized protein n=1 Tax=Gemmata algarum TaxID=2975278 RepID=A0ABU5EV68_9BACT|nr:hypothetical protein [Gemmata algarum]MDY3557621.1 hypothetical protein [Gemmata algarum]